MNTIAEMETIGLNDNTWNSLPRDTAEALLRICTLPAAEDRSYTNVQILPTPSGQNLYVRSSFSG